MPHIGIGNLYVTTAEADFINNRGAFFCYQSLQELAKGRNKKPTSIKYYKACYREVRKVFDGARVDASGITWRSGPKGVFISTCVVRCEFLKVLLEQPNANIY
ncbi:MAG TPA: hypothetical protein VGA67_02840 [Candidatus Dojkabacteria bacterium]